jgi:hypothetical protein
MRDVDQDTIGIVGMMVVPPSDDDDDNTHPEATRSLRSRGSDFRFDKSAFSRVAPQRLTSEKVLDGGQWTFDRSSFIRSRQERESDMCEVMDTRGAEITMIGQEGCACVMVLCCVQSNFRE